MPRKSKKLWAAAINLSGLYHTTPLRVYLEKDLETWFAEDGNFSIAKVGEHREPYRVTFAHADKGKVDAWISGVNAVSTVLRTLLGNGKE